MARPGLPVGVAHPCAALGAALEGRGPRAAPACPPEPAINTTVRFLFCPGTIKHGHSPIKHGHSLIKHGHSPIKHGHSLIKHGHSPIKHRPSQIKHGRFQPGGAAPPAERLAAAVSAVRQILETHANASALLVRLVMPEGRPAEEVINHHLQQVINITSHAVRPERRVFSPSPC